MSAPTNPGTLLPLFAALKACPSPASRVSQKLLIETWGCFKHLALEHGEPVTPAILAGLLLHDPESFAPLLNAAEHAQLTALGRVAVEHYLQQLNPPNPLGKTLAASLQEST